jgi:hypothetical protein
MSARRDVYMERALGALAKDAERLDRLRAEALRARGEARAALERELDGLRGACNRAAARIEDVRRAPEDAWSLAKVPADRALAGIEAELDRLEAHLRPHAA